MVEHRVYTASTVVRFHLSVRDGIVESGSVGGHASAEIDILSIVREAMLL